MVAEEIRHIGNWTNAFSCEELARIRRISFAGYGVIMDDPNIIIEDYIRLEEEKALRRVMVYNWETAKYGKIWYDEDVHDLKSVETEFPSIVSMTR
ncbi:hypothetical protein Tco_1267488 [Tanacetum coccineum]